MDWLIGIFRTIVVLAVSIFIIASAFYMLGVDWVANRNSFATSLEMVTKGMIFILASLFVVGLIMLGIGYAWSPLLEKLN